MKEIATNRILKKMKFQNFLIIYLVICLISLLSVIPFNLLMSIYMWNYTLVPFSASLFLLLLLLLISFPFYDLSRQLIMRSDYKYRFIRSRLTSKIILVILFVAAFVASLVFYSPTTHNMSLALRLCISGILVGFLPTIPLMILFDTFDLPSNYSIKKNIDFNRKSTYIALVIIIVSTISQFFLFFNFAVFGVSASIFLSIFFILLYRFFKNEKEKLIPKKKITSLPLYLLVLQIVYILVTIAYCVIVILYMFALTRGYIIIYFKEFYSGLFLAIHGSFTLFHIVFYSILYTIMRRKGIFEYVNESSGIA